MAETMTYDPGTDSVTTENNLTPEEQDSLKVGEALEQQQEQLLAGKYKDAQELEKAYVELQKKLGDNESSEKPEAEETAEPTEDKADNLYEGKTKEELETELGMELTPAVELISKASTEYSQGGEITEETLAKFQELNSQDLISTYMQMYNKGTEMLGQEQKQAQVQDISDADVNTIKNSVGGDQAYTNLLGWAEQNLPQATLKAFDQLTDTGDAQAIQLAVNGLKMQYDDANGYEGRMLSGKAPQTSGDVYESQQQLVAAMSDPRYDNDPAYRQAVVAKLDRSNLDF